MKSGKTPYSYRAPDRANDATENAQRFSTVRGQKNLFEGGKIAGPGSLDDSQMVREALARAIRKCHKSRAQLADEITRLTGRKLTEIVLNKFTAGSRTDYRWPAELDRAFAVATGDDAILRCRIEAAGLFVITAQECELLELGREYLRQKRASEQVALLEKRLRGVEEI
jgi:hypothetical protein